MSRWRGRNDILPRLAIAQHPQLMTDKSAFSPLDKIALQSTPGWRAIWMECCVHDLPPTPATVKNLSLLCRNVCDARHKNHKSCAAARANTSAARHPRACHSAMCGQSSLLRSYNGGKIGSARAHQLRQLGDVGGDPPGLLAGEQLGRCPPSRLILEIDVGERLPVVVADNEGRPLTLTFRLPPGV